MERVWDSIKRLKGPQAQQRLTAAVAKWQNVTRVDWKYHHRPVWWEENAPVSLPDGHSVLSLHFGSRRAMKWNLQQVRATLFLYEQWSIARHNRQSEVDNIQALQLVQPTSTSVDIGAGLSLTSRLDSHTCDEWVGDKVLNSFMFLQNKRNFNRFTGTVLSSETHGVSEWHYRLFGGRQRLKVLALNSFAFPRIESDSVWRMKAGRRWSIEGHGSVLEMDIIMIPVFLPV